MAIKSQTSGLAASIAAVNLAIDEKRERIAALQFELASVEAASADAVEIASRVDRAISDAAGGGNLRFDELSMPVEGDWRTLFDKRAAASPLSFFATIAPAALRAALIDGAPMNGISAAERAVRLAEIEAELLSLECQEELLCRGFEVFSGGRRAEFPRRPDARPEILCAPDSELEA